MTKYACAIKHVITGMVFGPNRCPSLEQTTRDVQITFLYGTHKHGWAAAWFVNVAPLEGTVFVTASVDDFDVVAVAEAAIIVAVYERLFGDASREYRFHDLQMAAEHGTVKRSLSRVVRVPQIHESTQQEANQLGAPVLGCIDQGGVAVLGDRHVEYFVFAVHAIAPGCNEAVQYANYIAVVRQVQREMDTRVTMFVDLFHEIAEPVPSAIHVLGAHVVEDGAKDTFDDLDMARLQSKDDGRTQRFDLDKPRMREDSFFARLKVWIFKNALGHISLDGLDIVGVCSVQKRL